MSDSIYEPLRICRLRNIAAPALESGATLTVSKVEGEAQGDEKSLQKLLKDLHQGPSAAHVVKVEKTEQEVKEGESSFEAQ